MLFDTHKFILTLQNKGKFNAEQSEAMTEALGDAMTAELATKTDLTLGLGSLRSDLKIEIGELKTALAETKSEIIKWMFAQTVVILGVALAIMHFSH